MSFILTVYDSTIHLANSKRLFDKRGAKYSSRPPNHIGNDIMCPNETHILLVPYGEGWRLLRKAAQRSLNGKFVSDVLPIQNAESTRTLYQLLHGPEGYYDHIRRYSTALILSSVFGQRAPDTFESPKVQALYHAQDQFTAILEPGATPPVDEFPLLKYVPSMFAKWKVWAKNIRAEQRSLYIALFEETKDIVARGINTGTFMGQILCNQEKSGLDDEHVAYLGGTMVRILAVFLFRKTVRLIMIAGSRIRHHRVYPVVICLCHGAQSERIQKGSAGGRRCLWYRAFANH